MSVERTYRYTTDLIGPEQRRALSGLEVLERIRDGRLPMAAIADTLAFRLVEVAAGSVIFVGTPQPFAFNMHGTLDGGWTATVLDSAMGCAVQTTVPRGFGYTTVDLTIKYLRAVTATDQPLRATGRVLRSGRRIATAEGQLHDPAGRLVAHGLTTCLLFPIDGQS